MHPIIGIVRCGKLPHVSRKVDPCIQVNSPALLLEPLGVINRNYFVVSRSHHWPSTGIFTRVIGSHEPVILKGAVGGA